MTCLTLHLGLDSGAAYQVGQAMRALSARGTPVLAALLQPSWELVKLFDKVRTCLLSFAAAVCLSQLHLCVYLVGASVSLCCLTLIAGDRALRGRDRLLGSGVRGVDLL